jgi:hypothetical membrane protein
MELKSKSNWMESVIPPMAGLIAPVAFTVTVVVQGLLQPDYSHVQLPISALAAWPWGWLQNLNFLVFGLLMIALAVGLHRRMRSNHRGIIGPVLLVLSGFGVLLAGAFPWQRAGEEFIVPAGHLAGAALTFLGAGTGLIAISRRMASDPRWRSVAAYVLASGVAIVALFLLIMGFARAEDSPLHPWAGLLQRLVLAVWFPCTILLALRLWHVARITEQAVGDGEVASTAAASAMPPRPW